MDTPYLSPAQSLLSHPRVCVWALKSAREDDKQHLTAVDEAHLLFE